MIWQQFLSTMWTNDMSGGFFVSLRKSILPVVAGLVIGTVLPLGLYYWPDSVPDIVPEFISELHQSSPTTTGYHFIINEGILSVVEGLPGQAGPTVLTGLDVTKWPEDIKFSAPQFQFDSLDEVQSFIDTVSEPVWIE